MSKKKQQPAEEASEGWESLAEEGGAASLPENPELEAALAEAAAAVDSYDNPGSRGGGAVTAEATEVPEEVALQLKQTEDRLVRLQADFENFRRRANKERIEANQYGHQNLVKDLLATVDNLERGIDHARQSAGGDLESLLQGVELVQRELLAALTKHGVVRIEALGQPFDPAVHEAMAQTPDGSVEPNAVIEELQTGYKLRDRLLRPSRVIVAKAAETTEGQPPEQATEPGQTQPEGEEGDAD
jgi:molecular chaperone GrpE